MAAAKALKAKKSSAPGQFSPKAAWERFERAVDYAIKTPPRHRVAKKQRPAGKGRVRKGKSGH
ncbi:MAG TPA: hypothetical protein VEI03_02355 [Stellaceae bacterium]|nr:hypothetical protein [Stellaceae bacterium]